MVYVYVPACWGVFSWNLVYQWVGFRHGPNPPNLQIWVYFGEFCQKSTQFGLNWVFFCRKWYIEGSQNCAFCRYSERRFFGVWQAHTHKKFGREQPPHPHGVHWLLMEIFPPCQQKLWIQTDKNLYFVKWCAVCSTTLCLLGVIKNCLQLTIFKKKSSYTLGSVLILWFPHLELLKLYKTSGKKSLNCISSSSSRIIALNWCQLANVWGSFIPHWDIIIPGTMDRHHPLMWSLWLALHFQ